MKRHKREPIVGEAQGKIGMAINRIAMEYDLTYGEMTRIVASELAHLAKWMIRAERHPDDPNRPGGLE